MKVLIFGGSGFIGGNLSKYLGKNHQVETCSLRNLDSVRNLDRYDVIINLVGKAHDHKGLAKESDFFYVNYDLLKVVYNYFVQSKSGLLIHVSSIAALEEFGSKHVLREDAECNPVSWYGKSKLAGENFLLDKINETNGRIVILRPTMVHGKGDKGNLGLLFNFVVRKIPYPLSKFNNQRTFLYIDNFSYLVSEIINKNRSVTSGIYHICDDTSVSTLEIVEMIQNVVGIKAICINVPKRVVRLIARIGDVIPIPLNTKRLRKMTSNLVVSNDKLKEELKVSHLPTEAEAGLRKTFSFFVEKNKFK